MDFESKSRILLLTAQAGIEAYNYYADFEEGFTDLDILIGAYGDPSTYITPELVDLLKSDAEAVDLRYFESRAIRSQTKPK